MLKTTLIAAGALAALVCAPALTAPDASAEAPKGKDKANKYVACTNKLKAKSPRRASDIGGRDFLTWQRGHKRP